MTIDVVLHETDRVDACFDGLTLTTEQDGSAPAPFDLFLASMATCVGFYVSRFCRSRDIDPRGVRIRQESTRDPETRRIGRVVIDIQLPDGFPDKYRDAVVRSAEQCSVKKHLETPPSVEVRATAQADVGSTVA